MDISCEVTVVMTSYNEWDFTLASIDSIRYHYPVRIILADGGSKDLDSKRDELARLGIDIVYMPGSPIEDCRNAAAFICETPYILFCDNDVKVDKPGAIELLLYVFERYAAVAQTGAYGVVVFDRVTLHSAVGRNFKTSMRVDACPAYWSLHRRDAYIGVGGMPKNFCFYEMPRDIRSKMYSKPRAGYGGDFSISVKYQRAGWCIRTPDATVPVVHWGDRYWRDNSDHVFESWWHKNAKHEILDPFTPASVAEAARNATK